MFPSSFFKYFILKHIFLLLHCIFVKCDIFVLSPENSTVEYFIDYKITYTPTIPDSGIIGFLVHSSPADACSPIDPPPKVDHRHPINWFVLAERSDYHYRCSYREKIQNAANAGYKAIIFYNALESYFQSSISYNHAFEHINITIPGLLVSRKDGEALRTKYMHNTGYKILISSDMSQNISYYLLPFAIVIGVCLLMTISFMLFQLMRCFQERKKAQRYRLSKKYLKKLTLQKYEKGIYYETCAICLDDYVEGEKIRILPCNHAYHMKCIDPWLTKNRRVCPVCKAKVTVPGMEEYSDTDSESESRRPASFGEVSERTRLLPSNLPSRSRRDRRLSRSSLIPRNDVTVNDLIRSNYSSTSRSNQMLDDTYFQPGPSTSAPVITDISSVRTHGNRNKRKRNNRNVQITVAEIAPLIAPPQLSINCDSESERPVTPQNIENNQDLLSQAREESSMENNSRQSYKQPPGAQIV